MAPSRREERETIIAEPGARGQVRVNGRPPANLKAERTLAPGDVVEVRLAGGGGYGAPAGRDPVLRARDRVERHVTNGTVAR